MHLEQIIPLLVQANPLALSYSARILHLDSIAAHRGALVDLRAGVVVATFIKRQRIHVEPLVVELYGRLQEVALLVVALDKLHLPRRVSTYVHQLVPVVAGATDEEKSFLVDLGLDLSNANRALQFRQVHIGASVGILEES